MLMSLSVPGDHVSHGSLLFSDCHSWSVRVHLAVVILDPGLCIVTTLLKVLGSVVREKIPITILTEGTTEIYN